jgi:hypothetical protein
VKRTLELIHKFLPFVPASAIIIMLVHILIATVYLKQIPFDGCTMPSCAFDEQFGYGIHKLHMLGYVFWFASYVAIFAWLIFTILGVGKYHSSFHLSRTSVGLVIGYGIAIVFLAPLTGWYFG